MYDSPSSPAERFRLARLVPVGDTPTIDGLAWDVFENSRSLRQKLEIEILRRNNVEAANPKQAAATREAALIPE